MYSLALLFLNEGTEFGLPSQGQVFFTYPALCPLSVCYLYFSHMYVTSLMLEVANVNISCDYRYTKP